MKNNTPNHDWDVTVPVKIGKKFYVNITPERAVVNSPVYVEIKDDLGLNVEKAKIWLGSVYGAKYKGAVSKKNEVFSFTPDRTGYFLIHITKEDEGYCEYTQQIEARHNITVYGPYSERGFDDPVVGDEVVIRVYDEENEPIPGVSITVSGVEEIYLNTDRAGGVLFVANKAGEHHIKAEKSTPPHWGFNKTVYIEAKPVLMITASPERPLSGDDVTVKVINENAKQ